MALLAILLMTWAVPVFAAPVTITAMWDANPEPDIAGYKLSYGTQTGVYTTTIDVGKVTSYPLSLNPGQYYFALQAYNTSGLISAYSAEVPYLLTAGTGPAIVSVTPNSGPAGTPVAIAGSGFGATQGTSTVAFGSVNGSPTAWSDTSISVAVPASATTGSVTVSVGGVASNGVTFTVVPAPSITSLSPAKAAIGASVTIAGANFGATQGTSVVKFFNGVTATPTSWSATSIVTPVPTGAATGSVTVTVNGVVSNGAAFTVNQPPTLAAVSNQSSSENGVVSLQLSGADPNGDTLTYSATSLPPGLSVSSSTGLISGTLTFTSAGTYNVTATVSDGTLTASRSFTWTVANVNRTPTLAAVGNQSGSENAAASLQLSGSDPDGDTLTYSATSLPPGLSVNSSTGLISGTPSFSSAGTYNVTATVSDGTLTASRSFTWTIANVNRTPTLAAVSNQSSSENGVVSLQLSGSDPDGDTLTYSATSLPPGLSVSSSTGLISGTLTFTSAGTYNVTATVSDGTLTASRSFTWTVANVNRTPTLAAVGNQSGSENAAASLQLSGSDPDGDTLSYSATSLPPGLSVNSSTGLISGTPSFTSAGTYNVTATVSDGTLTASRSFTWTVANVDRAPALAAVSNQSSAENGVISLQLSGSDPDGDTLTYSAASLPAGLGVNPSTGLISGTLTFTSAGTYNVTVTVSDGTLTGSQAFTWTVANVDRAPALAVVANQSSAENGVISLQLAGSDPDGDTLTYGATSLPGGLGVNPSTGLISGTLTSTSAGSYTVTATVSDGTLSASQTFMWTVANVNRPPALAAIANQMSAENTAISLQAAGSDPDGDTIKYSAVNLPGGLTINVNTGLIAGTLTYTSAGSYAVTVTVADGSLLTASQTFTWVVTDVNRPPALAQPANQSGTENVALSLQLVGNDPDGTPVTYSAAGLPAGVTINAATGLISGTPTLSSAGTYTVTASASDGSLTASRTFTWTIANTNQAPTLVQPADQVNSKNAVVSVQLAATDPDSDPLQFSATGLPPGVTITPASGLVAGTLSANSTGAYSVTVTVSDGSLTNSKTFTWTVKDTAGPPSLQQPADQFSGRNSPVSLQLQGTDEGGLPLTYSATGLPGAITVSPATGMISGSTGTTNAGAYVVTATVSNGTLTSSRTFTWTVNNSWPRGDVDGDRKADPTIFRPTNGTWYVLKSQGSYTTQAALPWGTATDVLVPGDYDGDGKLDAAFFRPSTAQWQILYSGSNYATSVTTVWGVAGDIPVAGDYDGDGKADLAVFHPATGQWQIKKSSDGTTLTIAWGVATDVVAPGDYDGDGRTDLAVFRPSTGTWFILESHSGYTTQWSRPLGVAGDLLVPADYDGDGKTDTAIYHPASGQWKIVLSGTGTTTTATWGAAADIPVPLDFDGDGRADIAFFHCATGQWQIVPSSTGVPLTLAWGGAPTDRPVPDAIRTVSAAPPPPQPPRPTDLRRSSDFDGDGKADITVYRPSTGTWYTLKSSGGYTSQSSVPWGTSTDLPVAGDYDGDGLTDPAFYRPSTGEWQILLSTTGFASSRVVTLGAPGDFPVPGDYDGDGKTDVAIYHPATGQWQIVQSSTGLTRTVIWGASGGVPIPADYDGDGRTDLAVYRPSSGLWLICYSATQMSVSVIFGSGLDVPVPGDYDGDGRADIAVYHGGQWRIFNSASGTLTTVSWGAATDVPVPADYDGDGRIDLAVIRPSTGLWYVLESHSGWTTQWSVAWGAGTDRAIPNTLIAGLAAVRARPPVTDALRASDFDGDGIADVVAYRPADGTWNVLTSSSQFSAPLTFTWGTATDVLVAGDYDGDGHADPAFYRPATGEWQIQYSTANYAAQTVPWGIAGDVPVPGDYDGDGRTDIAVFRPSTGEWWILTSSSNYQQGLVGVWGAAGDRPVQGDYDGDGKTDLAVFRPSTGQWIVLFSGANYTTSLTQRWGVGTDVPVAGDFDGDGRMDIAVYRPSAGVWYVLQSRNGWAGQMSFVWGGALDTLVVADFDGDGKADPTVVQGGTTWKALLSGTGYTTSMTRPWGLIGDIPWPKRP